MKPDEFDELFEDISSSYNTSVDDKIVELLAIILEIQDTCSKYVMLKDSIYNLFHKENANDNDTLQVYELFFAIMRSINRLHLDLLNLIQKEAK